MATSAELEKFMNFTKKWEGGLSRDPDDSASSYPNPLEHKGKTGWHTNVGITYKVWESTFGEDAARDFFVMPEDMWFEIFKKKYWDSVKADKIESFGVAAYVTGMAWGSGAKRAGELLQKAIKNLGGHLTVDGAIGKITLRECNALPPQELFDELLYVRENFFRSIAKPGTKNARFLKGWLNRLEDYRKTFRPAA